MKIALVVHDARPGGGQDRYVLELANRLSETHVVADTESVYEKVLV